jgi:hypothetical protein
MVGYYLKNIRQIFGYGNSVSEGTDMRDISEKQAAGCWNANAPVWIDQVGKGFDWS